MPIPRRISQSALQAIQPVQPNERSGTYPIPTLEDEDEFAHVGELPSLMPAPAPVPRSSPMLRVVEKSPPQSYRSVQMPAVRPSYGDSSPGFGDDEEPTQLLALDLQVKPSTHTTGLHTMAGNEVPQAAPATPAKQPIAGVPAGRMSGTYPAAAGAAVMTSDPKPGIVAFAGYGIPPTALSQMPSYALRVVTRRMTLRSDLKIARMRRLPQREIELYEAALRCADEGVVTKGLALIVSSIVVILGVIAAVSAAVL